MEKMSETQQFEEANALREKPQYVGTECELDRMESRSYEGTKKTTKSLKQLSEKSE